MCVKKPEGGDPQFAHFLMRSRTVCEDEVEVAVEVGLRLRPHREPLRSHNTHPEVPQLHYAAIISFNAYAKPLLGESRKKYITPLD